MPKKELTCIVCPTGCSITVTFDDDGRVIEIIGNSCPRGRIYAESEVTHPVRTLTSTVVVETAHGRRMLPVKTDRPIPKEALLDGMAIVKRCKAAAPARIGDVLYADFMEIGTNLVACKDIE